MHADTHSHEPLIINQIVRQTEGRSKVSKIWTSNHLRGLRFFRSVSEDMGFKAAIGPTKEHKGKKKKPSPPYVGITALWEALYVGL